MERLNDRNLLFERGINFLKEATDKKCDFVALPEMWLTGFNVDKESVEISQKFLNYTLNFSKGKDVVFIPGTFPERENNITYNTAFVIYDGRIVAKRRKRFLFALMKEPEIFSSGEPPKIIELKKVRFGIAICYELRFPEVFKKLSLEKAHLIVVPAQWPHDRISHWRTLLKARAIENQCFVAGINVVGKTSKLFFSGFSSVIHPLGDPMVEVSRSEGLFVVDIDFKDVIEYRKNIPVLDDSIKYAF